MPSRPRTVRTRTIGAQTKLDATLLDKATDFFDREAETRWHGIALDVATPTSKSRLQLPLPSGDSASSGAVSRDVLSHDLQEGSTVASMIEKRVLQLQAKFEDQLKTLRVRNARLETVVAAAAAAGVPEATAPGLRDAQPGNVPAVSSESHAVDALEPHQALASHELSECSPADIVVETHSDELAGADCDSKFRRSHVAAHCRESQLDRDAHTDAMVKPRFSNIDGPCGTSGLAHRTMETSDLDDSSRDGTGGEPSLQRSMAIQCSISQCIDSDSTKLASLLKSWSPVCNTSPQAQLSLFSEMVVVLRRKLREMSKAVQTIRAAAGPGSIL